MLFEWMTQATIVYKKWMAIYSRWKYQQELLNNVMLMLISNSSVVELVCMRIY